ncbi:MAG: DNA-directed RNA polymerase subunit beta [Candidatus Shapirobacteria bacterium]
MTKPKRIYEGNQLKLPRAQDLIEVQKQSWQWFLDLGLREIFSSLSPITDYTGNNWEIHFKDLEIEEPKISPSRAREKGLTYSLPLNIKTSLTNKRTGSVVEEDVFIREIPTMTPEGTFVIDGVERGIVNQLVRSPGVYFTDTDDPKTGRSLFEAEIRPLRGSWLEFLIGRKDIIYARIDRRRKFPATVILKCLGLVDEKELIKKFSDFIRPTLEADSTKTREEAFLEFYRKMRPGEPLVLENAINLFKSVFSDIANYEIGRVGRYKINKRLGLTFPVDDPRYWVLVPQDIIKTIEYLIKLEKGEERKLDDIDHLGNRRLRSVGEILSQTILRRAASRFERGIKERMSLASTKDKVRPSSLLNFQPFLSALLSFFKTSRLSSILDQTNPLAELSLLRKITVIGPGGISRERATFSIRDIHSSQYGRVCPIKSPEGINIGLMTYLSLFTRVNEYGFLETPYRKIKLIKKGREAKVKITDEVVYLSADDESDYYITHAGVAQDRGGFLKPDWVPARYQGEFIEVPKEKIQLIDYSPQQVLGLSASLIPFVAHDEANRALMGANMQCQAVPLVQPEAPIVGTGMEFISSRAMNRIALCQAPGVVDYVDAKKVIIKPGNKRVNVGPEVEVKGGKHVYHLFKYQRTSPNDTCYNQRPLVEVGQKVKEGNLLADGPSMESGELALGKNLLIAYACIDGLGYEDSIVVSDKLVKNDILTSIHISEYEARLVDTKLGPEELTKDIPGVAENDLARLTEEGIIMIGSEVTANDILVGKVEPKGEKELSAEERLLRAIFGEKAKDVKDTSLRVPHGEGGIVIGVRILDREKGDQLDPGVNKIIKVAVAQLRKIREGDKVAGRHGNKGVVSRVLPEADMPHLADGTPVDIVISPLSVIARMNLGQILEAHLAWAGKRLGEQYTVPSFEKLNEETLVSLLKKANLPVDGKVKLFDGKTGLPYEQKVAVGVAYILKLHHMAEDKVHARATGPYSLVTQQPLGGKTRMGGQRFGEMEVWALEAHRAAYSLQEMLTLKSDDIEGRAAAFQAIIKGQEIPAPTLPESFKVLVRELAGLGILISPTQVIAESEKELEEK